MGRGKLLSLALGLAHSELHLICDMIQSQSLTTAHKVEEAEFSERSMQKFVETLRQFWKRPRPSKSNQSERVHNAIIVKITVRSPA